MYISALRACVYICIYTIEEEKLFDPARAKKIQRKRNVRETEKNEKKKQKREVKRDKKNERDSRTRLKHS